MDRDVLWIAVYESIKQGIQEGLYTVGEYLPSEQSFTQKYAVSRHTVREALRQLKLDGLLASKQGGGSIVLNKNISSGFNVHKVSSLEQLMDYAARGIYQIHAFEWTVAAPYVDGNASTEKSQRWMKFEGVRESVHMDSYRPICWTSVYVPEEFESIKDRLTAGAEIPVWQMIENTYEQKIKNIDQIISLRNVPRDMANRFQLKKHDKVVSVARIYENTLGQVIEVSVNLYPADNFEFRMQLNVTP